MRLSLTAPALAVLFLAGLAVPKQQTWAQDNSNGAPPYITIPYNTAAQGPKYEIPCPNNSCGDKITAFPYIKQGNEAYGHENDPGVTACVNANLRPLAIIMGAPSSRRGTWNTILHCTMR